jgi:hypothetical protein
MNDLPDFHKMLSSNRDFFKNRLSDVDLLLKSINDISLFIFMLASLGTIRYKMCSCCFTEQYVSFVKIGTWKATSYVRA